MPSTVTFIGLLGDSTSVHAFETAVVVLGGLLVLGALVSGIAHRSFLSLTALFVVAGFVLGHGALDVLDFDPQSGFVSAARDRRADRDPVPRRPRGGGRDAPDAPGACRRASSRSAMPVTAAIVALAAKWLTDLSWTESFLLGALLSPTDPVLSSSVVTNPRVPRLIRHSLNLESGLNDGLALAPVLALAAALRLDDKDFTWWTFVLQDVGLGVVFGVGLRADRQRAAAARGDPGPPARALRARRRVPDLRRDDAAAARQRLDRRVRRRRSRSASAGRTCAPTSRRRGEDIVEIVKLGVFVVFGSLLTFDGLFDDGWAAVAIVVVTLLVARPVALWLALAGTGTDTPTKAFMAWFGPKGVATMTFSLLVLSQPDRRRASASSTSPRWSSSARSSRTG